MRSIHLMLAAVSLSIFFAASSGLADPFTPRGDAMFVDGGLRGAGLQDIEERVPSRVCLNLKAELFSFNTGESLGSSLVPFCINIGDTVEWPDPVTEACSDDIVYNGFACRYYSPRSMSIAFLSETPESTGFFLRGRSRIFMRTGTPWRVELHVVLDFESRFDYGLKRLLLAHAENMPVSLADVELPAFSQYKFITEFRWTEDTALPQYDKVSDEPISGLAVGASGEFYDLKLTLLNRGVETSD